MHDLDVLRVALLTKSRAGESKLVWKKRECEMSSRA